MPKICSSCHETKELSEFYRKTSAADGYNGACKVCIDARNQAWYAANREKRAAYQVEHRAKNRARIVAKARERYLRDKEKINAYTREYRLRNRDALVEKDRAYYIAHRAEHYAKMREWSVKNPDKVRDMAARNRLKNRAQRQTAGRAYFLRNRETLLEKERARYKALYAAHPELFKEKYDNRRALKKGAAEITLTAAQWEEIKAHYGHRCAYCGRKMQRLEQEHIQPLSKGGLHTIQNVVPACRSCNAKKHDGPPLKPVQPMLLTIAPPKKKRGA